MKLSKMAFLAAIASGVYAGNAHAQQLRQTSAPSAAYVNDYYFSGAIQPSPSDQPPPMPAAPLAPADKMYAPAQAPTQAPSCECQPACEAEEEAVCEPWRLFHQKECGWNIYGFIAAGATANGDSPPSRYNGPVTFNDRREGMLNQLYLIAENKIDTGGCGWDVGGRVDLLYGTDYIFTQATGLETQPDGSPRWNSSPYYGLAMPQAYLELGYNDWAVKLGHFYTPIGYEVVPANGNFFYSHAYTMQYGEPFTHTGGLATYKYSDSTNINLGFVNGWDNFDRENDTGALIAGFTWTNGDDLSISLNGIVSPNESRNPLIAGPAIDTNRDMYSLVVSYNFWEKFQYVFQHDAGYQRNGSVFTQGATSAEWYGINQYLFYTINDCWKAGARVEWFRDDDGARVGGIRATNPLPDGGFAGDFYEISAGLNWSPSANLTVRPEIRYDWFDGESFTGARPYNDGNDDEQFLAAFDVIFLY